jgi:hypothetical protein
MLDFAEFGYIFQGEISRIGGILRLFELGIELLEGVLLLLEFLLDLVDFHVDLLDACLHLCSFPVLEGLEVHLRDHLHIFVEVLAEVEVLNGVLQPIDQIIANFVLLELECIQVELLLDQPNHFLPLLLEVYLPNSKI